MQIVHVLHMFHTSKPRCTIRDFCLHTKRFEIRVFVLAQFASCLYCEHLIFLMPWTRFEHFFHIVTRHHPFVSLARSMFSRGTFLTFHVSLCCRFLFRVFGINASWCITIGAQGHPLQVGSTHAQRCMLFLIPILCGDPIGRAGSQPFIIRHHAHILTLTLAF